MTETDREYRYEIELKQELRRRGLAMIVLDRPWSRLGSYGPLKRQPELRVLSKKRANSSVPRLTGY